jgi:hypothetical protein
MCGHTDVLTTSCADIQMRRHPDVRTSRCADIQMCGHPAVLKSSTNIQYEDRAQAGAMAWAKSLPEDSRGGAYTGLIGGMMGEDPLAASRTAAELPLPKPKTKRKPDPSAGTLP